MSHAAVGFAAVATRRLGRDSNATTSALSASCEFQFTMGCGTSKVTTIEVEDDLNDDFKNNQLGSESVCLPSSVTTVEVDANDVHNGIGK